MIITNTCPSCGNQVELDHEQIGHPIDCPHCHHQFNGYSTGRRAGTPPPSFSPPQAHVSSSARSSKKTMSRLAALFLILVGIALIFSGCSADREAKSAMHQIYGAIQFCSGWLMIAAAALYEAIVMVHNKD